MKVTLSSLSEVLAAQRRASHPVNPRKKASHRPAAATAAPLPDNTTAVK
ncbi:hypothetical protein [Hymenobacter metallilatus]|nr:hypothetical protein [Hymenobacter metallilatus]